jgi:hypothetical protein
MGFDGSAAVAVGQLGSPQTVTTPPKPPAPISPAPAGRNLTPVAKSTGPSWRIRMASTPGRLTRSMAILFVLVLLFGVTGVVGALNRGSDLDAVRHTSGPLTLQAQSLYRSLSDADATEAAAFLSAGSEPPALRTRYLNDISTASAALTAVSASSDDTDALRQLSAGLPIYTGLVESARADNRLGLPLGAAYLREASGQMRTVLLPAASDLYTAETRDLTSDRGGAGGFPWVVLPLGLIVLVLLVRAQLRITRRTNRVFNPGLVAATLALLITVGWVGISWGADAVHLHHSAKAGSDEVALIAEARVDLLRARSDESLTLVARGNDTSFEKDFQATMTDLNGSDSPIRRAEAATDDGTVNANLRAAQSDLSRWQAEHTAIRTADDGGDYPTAVDKAIGTGSGDAPALFTKVDTDLGNGIDAADATFVHESDSAANSQAGQDIGIIVLTLIALAGLTVGFQRRIAEYR